MSINPSALDPSALRGHHNLSLYNVTVVDDVFVATTADPALPFDLAAYSKFKYGCRNSAAMYSRALARVLSTHLAPVLAAREQVVVIGTPYKRLPNAARMLAITVEGLLRSAGLPTSYSYIYQHRLAAGDYGTLSTHERDRRNQQKKRYLDPEDFSGRHVVVIDDVRITGSIERSITAMLSEVDVLSITVTNLVMLDPVVAAERPHLEDRLNHHAVSDLHDLLRLMADRDRFTLTTRAVKFILQSKPEEVQWLLDRLDPDRITELYEGIVDDGYDQMIGYYPTFNLVLQALNH